MRTRETVLVAAGEAFAENGFLGTSMADILARAGVTKGALYFHFSSKEELAFALIEEEELRAARVADDVSRQDLPPLQALVTMVHHWAQCIQTDPVIRAGVRLIVEQGTYSRPMPAPYGHWDTRVAELLDRAALQGDLRTGVDTAAAARFVVAAFTGVQLVSQITSGHQDLTERLQTMWELLLAGLLTEGRSVVLIPGGTP